jgi:hypothetical protein
VSDSVEAGCRILMLPRSQSISVGRISLLPERYGRLPTCSLKRADLSILVPFVRSGELVWGAGAIGTVGLDGPHHLVYQELGSQW